MPPQRMVREIVDHAQPQVGERAHRQRHAVAREPRDQRVVFERAVAVIDALDAEHVERLPDIVRRPFLAGMRGQEKPASRARRNTCLNCSADVPSFG